MKTLKGRYAAANYPTSETNVFLGNYSGSCAFTGLIDKTIRFVEAHQMMNPVQWRRFVEQFRMHSDTDNGWRGEYWGKMMRGACFTYDYTHNENLYTILTQTVQDMIDSADENGRISSYPLEKEFTGWDIWSRKYVLLGMQYYLEICTDESLATKLIESMCRQTDYIIEKIGPKTEGKLPITEATSHWRGLNSSSLLEPIVRLYHLTDTQKYLDFATYIVNEGGTSVINIFDLAYDNDFHPYQYPVTKAYEMISCFDGLLEYYRITKIKRYKKALINFADRILSDDFTIIGGSGCTHELFDHSTVRQANTTNGEIMQETCVTVTLMKFFYQMTLLTGNVKYVDAFERSLYNAYLGSINTEQIVEPSLKKNYPHLHTQPLPFDSYSPLTAGTRGNRIGGFNIMPDNHYYGCCACIGALGTGLIPKMALMKARDKIAINLYIPGQINTETPAGSKLSLMIETGYPRDGKVSITLSNVNSETFSLLLRNPEWSNNTKVWVNGMEETVEAGYIALNRQWKEGDRVELELDMRTMAIFPTPYGEEILMNKAVGGQNYMVPTYDREDPLAKHHVALRRGPLILAQDNRLDSIVGQPITIAIDKSSYVDAQFPESPIAPYNSIVELCIPTQDGTSFRVTDYASTGKLWSKESKMAAWILTGQKDI